MTQRKYATNYRGYRIVVIVHSPSTLNFFLHSLHSPVYHFNIYKLDRKTKLFTCTIPITTLKQLVSMIDSTIDAIISLKRNPLPKTLRHLCEARNILKTHEQSEKRSLNL